MVCASHFLKDLIVDWLIPFLPVGWARPWKLMLRTAAQPCWPASLGDFVVRSLPTLPGLSHERKIKFYLV